MCRPRWSDPPALDDDNYYDYFRWDFDCYDCVCLACNSRPFGCAAVSLCVVMNTIDQRTMSLAVVAAAVGDGVYHRFYCV